MDNKAIDYVLFCYFGSHGDDVDAVINRAYVDMASHTLKSFEEAEKRWECRWNASKEIKAALNNISDFYDEWHESICNAIISKYPENILSYGQAQKWINMTVKYIYVLKQLGKLNGQYEYISDEHVSEFHAPIDSYILTNILKDNETVWSKMNHLQYLNIREKLKSESFGFLDELQEWDEIVVGSRKFDKDSYGYFCHKKENEE